MTAAQIHALRGHQMQAEELLSEAVCRALDGTRKCHRNLSVAVFLIGAMRSIASAEWESRKASPPPLQASMENVETAFLQVPAADRTAEEAIAARQDLEQRQATLETMFQDDEEAFLVIAGDMEGMSADQIRQSLGLDATTYATIRRRIRRKINSKFPQGRSS